MAGVLQGGTSEITRERSRFLGFVFPLTTLEQARQIRADIKKEHYEAAHVVSAFVFDEVASFDDDGEPGGTAGRPLSLLLRSFEAERTMLIVVRYFGGRKLGTKWLRDAFSTTGRIALETTKWGTFRTYERLEVAGPLEGMAQLHRFVAETGVTIENIIYNNKMNVTIDALSFDMDEVRGRLGPQWTIVTHTVRRDLVAAASRKE